MPDTPRLIEFAFPLMQASLDSVHEKNVRHGHISTLHIWPARRPLAACRAALIATLLPDPSASPKPAGMSDDDWHHEVVRRRQELCEKIGGTLVKRIEKKKMPGGQVVEREKPGTEGGILHWGRETENAETMEWFRQEIRKVYGGRAPKVLDPFAGGGAIPLEAMRLGCETTAADINPVAWFILKCTLEYPQKLAGLKRPLPSFILKDRAFMESFFKAQGFKGKMLRQRLEAIGFTTDGERSLTGMGFEPPRIEADLAWHVRAWGQWVLARARSEMAPFYPMYADFEPLAKDQKSYEHQPMRLMQLKADGTSDIDGLNREFSAEYLAVKKNPRWVAKPTVAYLWARTVTCKNCRATIPLLKTRWLCKKDNNRVLLTMEPNREKTGVVFGIETNVAIKGANAAQRREHDKRLGAGTMTRAGADCPCCGLKGIMTMEDIRVAGQAKELKETLTSVVVDGTGGKEYRVPTAHEVTAAVDAGLHVERIFAEVPFGVPNEPIVEDAKHNTWCVTYGLSTFARLFTPRQLIAIGSLIRAIRTARSEMTSGAYSTDWCNAVEGFLAMGLDRLLDRCSTLCTPDPSPTQSGVMHVFCRFALPMTWDFIEGMTIASFSGGFSSSLEWVAKVAEHMGEMSPSVPPHVVRGSATTQNATSYDLIVTDPPYYDAIGYSVLMDFFYVWMRRVLFGTSPEVDSVFNATGSPKWDHATNDGELVDDASRHEGDATKSKQVYEDGMYRAFETCSASLTPEGRLVLVFAHKHPNAWETLVSAVIRAGFVVDASWPIQTERAARQRSQSSSALSSSVWLVCRKRPANSRPGWDNKVLEEMRDNIAERLRDFWDAGIRGPDFVWAATGPALEAYSKHPVVKKADDPGQVMTVTEFLNHARRMVVDFVVGRVLIGEVSDSGDSGTADRLDELTAYYLLHRHDFGMDDAPVGACILYATACGLSDQELASEWDILFKSGGDDTDDAEQDEDAPIEDGDEEAESSGSGSKVKLKAWNQRRGRSLGLEAPKARPVPLIDRLHRLMHLWKAGDVHKVDAFLDEHGLRRHELFRRVLQSLIEISRDEGRKDECVLLESLSNHIGIRGAIRRDPQRPFEFNDAE